MRKDIAVIILAAGKGQRMKSSLPKVLHPLAGRPMIGYILDLTESLKPEYKICVLGHEAKLVRDYIKEKKKGFRFVIQKRPLGSADAVKQAKLSLKNFRGTVLVLYADNPLLRLKTIKELIRQHHRLNAGATLLTATVDKPKGMGRIIRDTSNNICRIVEEIQANDYEKEIKEVNTGIACFEKDILFDALNQVKLNRGRKEYYLTDVIQILYRKKILISSLKLEDPQEAVNINSQAELSCAEKILQKRLLEAFMERGVRILDPDSTRVCWDTQIKKGTIVFPFTVIESNVKIGKDCRIGPFCHLRENVVIRDNSVVGNFTELSRSKLGQGAVAKHFCYLGDARVGRRVNIGAGTVTANFDGKKKNVTTIGEGAFIGSNSTLIAPVKIGKHATTGAGCVVTKNRNVPPGAVVVGVPARLLKRVARS